MSEAERSGRPVLDGYLPVLPAHKIQKYYIPVLYALSDNPDGIGSWELELCDLIVDRMPDRYRQSDSQPEIGFLSIFYKHDGVRAYSGHFVTEEYDLAQRIYTILKESNAFNIVTDHHLNAPYWISWIPDPHYDDIERLFRWWARLSQRKIGGMPRATLPSIPTVFAKTWHTTPARIGVRLDGQVPYQLTEDLGQALMFQARILQQARLALGRDAECRHSVAMIVFNKPAQQPERPQIEIFCHSEEDAQMLVQNFAMRVTSDHVARLLLTHDGFDGLYFRDAARSQAEIWRDLFYKALPEAAQKIEDEFRDEFGDTDTGHLV